MGISVSRNDCLDNATGDYFLFIDSDDYIETDMVEQLVDAAQKNNADIAGCSYIEEYDDHSVEMPEVYHNNHDQMMRDITLLRIKACMWKMLIRRSIVENNNVRFIPNRNMVDDYMFCCQAVFFASTFASVNKFLYHYIQYNPNNYSKRAVFNVESQALALIETEKFYKQHGAYEIVKEELLQRKFIAKLPLLLDKNCIDVGKWRQLLPESNGVWRHMNFSLGNKLIFLLSESPFFPLVKILQAVKS